MGSAIDFYMSSTRNVKAEKRFLAKGIQGEIRIIERAFGLGNCFMADMMNTLEIRLKAT